MLINPKSVILENSYTKDYEKLYKDSIENPETFWGNIARELLWFKPWNKVLDWQYPYARWFVGGQTNIVYNALDRWLKTDVADKTALIWVSQDGTDEKYTYKQLNEEVCKFANGLKSLGVRKGDKITIYLPRIPEQLIAMLACLKIGAVHSVVYSGFSAEALKNRIEDAQAKVVVCSNAYPYGKKTVESLKNVQQALKDNKTFENVIVVERIKQTLDVGSLKIDKEVGDLKLENQPSSFQPQNPASNFQRQTSKYIWWHELVNKQDTICSTEIMEATDTAFILYTSGTTGKPKGIIHAHGGYQVGIYYTLKTVFDIQPDDIFWSTADAGWITGHSYILYAPLINGITTFVYEGTPDYPDIEIWWKLIEKYKITKFYTAPTAIRALMKFGEEPVKKHNLYSLKILGSVGEPINPEAWLWYFRNVGREQIPIMDTWWQTETGMFMITPVPSVGLKPGSAFKPFFGIEADVVDDKGNKVPLNKQGYLIIKKPWPAMFLDVYNNPERYKETYFEKISNVYFTGDSAKIDEDGYYWIMGRNDDVIKVSGHRLGSAELESAFVSNPKVAEAAVIGKPHEVKGESIKAFVILKHGVVPSEELKKELVLQVRMQIGPIATPDEIEFVEKLPKTRSGKIMRRVLKAQELGQPVGDVSTLED
ncbi:MAG: Acetate/CoA ligase [Candidatus Roizmanbacteria bacterium GW2011_GWC2_37_13]|uniref:acetate--CoA ligase n=1 Tax=Candidatus Roizmanbacteria bacterium GW2011_GWC2_37_13 TaxID=1618486 RepID=A0A0G0G550_9BACT|nr:MAG: Acetate/CoA ligase [Candidatus Roizmanbacteria bacterium GW2011_GWC1_37_12]KKQ25152.1 MAG: Acetate/CoA ligase [Candidatus Roizmanbacteria bacterium GW2011_GWC2_37_13]